LIDSTGGEVEIQIVTCDHIQNPKFFYLVFDSISDILTLIYIKHPLQVYWSVQIEEATWEP